MNGGRFFLIVLGFCLCCVCLAVPLNKDEEKAKIFVQSANDRLQIVSNELNELGANLEETPPYELLNVLDKVMNAMKSISDIERESQQFDITNFKDDDLKNTFEQLRIAADETSLGRWRFEKILDAVNNVESLAHRKNIPKFRKKRVTLRYIPDIQNIISTTNNTQELRYYWNAWREQNSDLVLRSMWVITDGILDAAKETGVPALEIWMKGYNLTEMEHIMNETEPLYLQLHSFIRNQLRKKYGDSVIPADGIIPDHLFQQVLAQAWTNGSIIDEMYPLERLPSYNEILKQKKFDAMKLFKTANEFYKSLGFDSLPDDFFGTKIKMSSNLDEGDCKPTIYDITTNVSVRFCHKMDFRKFLQAHGYMGQVYYAREKKFLPAISFSSYDLEYSVGEAVILSASTLEHLKTIDLATDFQITDEVQFNRLLRMAIHTLINVRLNFVHSKVMADFFDGKVQIGLLNKHYWKLMDQYIGVGPPMNRLKDTFDFPFKFYMEVNENVQARKFNAEYLGYQFYHKLCQITGKYPAKPLHTCDFYGSKDAGDALKKMMKLGSLHRLKKVLATLLPENPTLSSDSLLEYYSPIKSWLTEENKATGAKLGWTHSKKKVPRVIMDSSEDYDDDE